VRCGLGVAEMTRFGMGPADFAEVAALIAAVIGGGAVVANEVKALRSRFTELGYCFNGAEFDPLVRRLHELI
jgi:glycine/serine hydroxymethyltransferase